MRSQEGKTSLGGKSIAKCSKCESTFSSNDLVNMAIDSKLNNWATPNAPMDGTFHHDKGLFCSSSATSKQQTQIEIYLMNQIAEQAKLGTYNIPYPNSPQFNKNLFFVNALTNFHNNEHCSKCFKHNHECRMKYPKMPSASTEITFDDHATPSFNWRGEQQDTYLHHLQLKRSKADAFSNVHNRIVSALFNCNNNVIAAVTGEFNIIN